MYTIHLHALSHMHTQWSRGGAGIPSPLPPPSASGQLPFPLCSQPGAMCIGQHPFKVGLFVPRAGKKEQDASRVVTSDVSSDAGQSGHKGLGGTFNLSPGDSEQ